MLYSIELKSAKQSPSYGSYQLRGLLCRGHLLLRTFLCTLLIFGVLGVGASKAWAEEPEDRAKAKPVLKPIPYSRRKASRFMRKVKRQKRKFVRFARRKPCKAKERLSPISEGFGQQIKQTEAWPKRRRRKLHRRLKRAIRSLTRAMAKAAQKCQYRTLRKSMRSRYKAAKATWKTKPCLSYIALRKFRKAKNVPKQEPALTRRYKRLIRRYYRRYRRYARRYVKRSFKRCQTQWRTSFPRKGALHQDCVKAFKAPEGTKAATLLVGVWPFAYVHIRNKFCGSAPFRLSVKPGVYPLRLFHRSSGKRYKTSLELKAGRTTLFLHDLKVPARRRRKKRSRR